MANFQIGNVAGVTAVGGTGNTNHNGGDNVATGYTDSDLATLASMRTRLAAINGAYYTTARLDSMSMNDMVYAIRLNDSPATIG